MAFFYKGHKWILFASEAFLLHFKHQPVRSLYD